MTEYKEPEIFQKIVYVPSRIGEYAGKWIELNSD